MSLHYILDGYNILNQIPSLAQRSLEDKRTALVSLIETYKPQGSARNKVTVVFDGQAGYWSEQRSSVVKVVFSVDESADDKIKRLVSEAENKRRIVVVTNDREIVYYVRGMKADVLSVGLFLQKLKPKRPKVKRQHANYGVRETTKDIPKTLEFSINSELEAIWLNKKRKKD